MGKAMLIEIFVENGTLCTSGYLHLFGKVYVYFFRLLKPPIYILFQNINLQNKYPMFENMQDLKCCISALSQYYAQIKALFFFFVK